MSPCQAHWRLNQRRSKADVAIDILEAVNAVEYRQAFTGVHSAPGNTALQTLVCVLYVPLFHCPVRLGLCLVFPRFDINGFRVIKTLGPGWYWVVEGKELQ